MRPAAISAPMSAPPPSSPQQPSPVLFFDTVNAYQRTAALFGPLKCESLLRKVRAALADGGRVATLEFIPDEDRVNPPMSATFALTMLGTTPAGDAYTFSEYERMFRNAGYRKSELYDLPGTVQRAVLAYKA